MKAYLGLGTNLGDKEANLREAIQLIEKRAGTIVRQSSLFFSEPWGFESSNSFINSVICIDTKLSPVELLDVTQKIERDMGRRQKSCVSTDSDGKPIVVYHDRIIDIDILIYEGVEMSTSRLTLPHPHISKRDFVRIPLEEIYIP